MGIEKLDLTALQVEVARFADIISNSDHPKIFGKTDGKAIGNYVENAFLDYLDARFRYKRGNSARGMDIPELNVDVKTTSVIQPQSSCPFKSADQKIFGLGYHLVVFVYDKHDVARERIAKLVVKHSMFIHESKTADHGITTCIREAVDSGAGEAEIVDILIEKKVPASLAEARRIAQQAIASPPEIGLLTISNALQWRLQYARAIKSQIVNI